MTISDGIMGTAIRMSGIGVATIVRVGERGGVFVARERGGSMERCHVFEAPDSSGLLLGRGDTVLVW